MTSFDMDPQTARILANPNHSHIVYPYTDDMRLADAVSFYTNNGLVRGNAVVLAVTNAHRHAIKKYLKPILMSTLLKRAVSFRFTKPPKC